MIEEQIPTGYKIYQEKKVTLIVDKDFEDLRDRLPWKSPLLFFSRYPLHPILQGRGQAATVPYEDNFLLFVKKLRHGGLFGNLFNDFFFRKRILGELINAYSMKSEGFHSPHTVFIIMEKRTGPLHEGYIGQELIKNAKNLLEIVQLDDWYRIKDNMLKAIATELKRFHDKGFFHFDLNAGNLLIRKGEVFKRDPQRNHYSDNKGGPKEGEEPYDIIFIDLDRMKRYEEISQSKRRKNIFRFFRSLKKHVPREKYTDQDDRLFLQWYSGDDGKMLSRFKRFYPLHRFSLVFHKYYWSIMKKS